jgi:hypothetical protein
MGIMARLSKSSCRPGSDNQYAVGSFCGAGTAELQARKQCLPQYFKILIVSLALQFLINTARTFGIFREPARRRRTTLPVSMNRRRYRACHEPATSMLPPNPRGTGMAGPLKRFVVITCSLSNGGGIAPALHPEVIAPVQLQTRTSCFASYEAMCVCT